MNDPHENTLYEAFLFYVSEKRKMRLALEEIARGNGDAVEIAQKALKP